MELEDTFPERGLIDYHIPFLLYRGKQSEKKASPHTPDMQSLSKNYQSVEESKSTFENSRLYLETSHQGKPESANTGKIVTSAEKNQTP